MGNYKLKAEVNRLTAQFREIERKNIQLRSEIQSAVKSINQAEVNLSAYNQVVINTLENAVKTINNSANRELNAYELQGHIDQLYTRFKCVELANKKIRTLNNKKYYEFNNYRTVRKIVQGMMDNIDLNMITDEVIYKSVERQHLQTPDYWLTSALISIMAWKNDDKLLADKALEAAVRLDKKNSSIFYMIFNMRMGRDNAAVKWFLEYQKCELKGSDENTFLMLFSLISKNLSDMVDDETSHLISVFLQNLIMECAEKEGCREEDIIEFICRKIQMLMKKEFYELPLMAKHCEDYHNIVKMLDMAANNYNILELIIKMTHVSENEKNTYLKDYLIELLRKPNSVEIETYKEIEYNEFVIRFNGDIEMAKAALEQELVKRESDLNVISGMISWIYDFGNENINTQMRLNMLRLVKTQHEKAIDRYLKMYRIMYKESHPVRILDYSAEINFLEEAAEAERVEQFYQEQQKHELTAVKNSKAYVVFGAGILCGIAAFYIHLLLFAGFGACIAVGAGIIILNHYSKKNIVLKVQKQKAVVLEILHKLFKENDKMRNIYKEFDRVSGKIKEELAEI